MAYVRRTPVLQRLLTSRPSEGTSRSCQGGFQALNETVRGHLRRWFEGMARFCHRRESRLCDVFHPRPREYPLPPLLPSSQSGC
jgi:hypothetical protein